MKAAFFILAALLAITSLAAVPFYDQRNVDLPKGAYWEGNNLIFSANDSDDEEEEDDGDQDVGEPAQDTRLSNITSEFLNKRQNAQEEWTVDIRVGGPAQHIGTLRKRRLQKRIFHCLQIIGVPHKRTGLGPNEVCTNTMQQCESECRIEDIVYNSGSYPPTYATDSYISIKTLWAEFNIDDRKDRGDIRDETFKFAADIFQIMSEDPNNCYQVDFPNSRKTTMCNVATHLLIVFPSNRANVQGRLNIQLEWNGKTHEGKFNCDTALPAIADHFKKAEGFRPRMAYMMNWNWAKTLLYNTCQRDTCFDTYSRYAVAKPWEEPEHCAKPESLWQL